jgi:homoserine kinase type II
VITVHIEHVMDEITTSIQAKFGLRITEVRLLEKGWLNVKWCVRTDRGLFFVKYYHPNRYKLHMPERRTKIEKTLILQQRLHELGVACPKVYAFKEAYIQETASGYHFIMMDWVQGRLVEAGKMSMTQMHQLGSTTGRMHYFLQGFEQDCVAWSPNQSTCVTELQLNLKQASSEQAPVLVDLLEQAIGHVELLDFNIFSESPVGWTHWDLWVDNIVMDEQRVAGIVDFDRMAVAYPEIDVARAILSGAFELDGFRMDAVQAFLTGYREHMEASKGLLIRSIQMLYFIESTWWLRTSVLQDTANPKRFFEELAWLTKNWDELTDICSDI